MVQVCAAKGFLLSQLWRAVDTDTLLWSVCHPLPFDLAPRLCSLLHINMLNLQSEKACPHNSLQDNLTCLSLP